ncbi:hypothetical protein PINS_up005441 [Pythium insidiosum]|nr:hypothetical protein PINS_up005441 [Pythium insidiosum]
MRSMWLPVSSGVAAVTLLMASSTHHTASFSVFGVADSSTQGASPVGPIDQLSSSPLHALLQRFSLVARVLEATSSSSSSSSSSSTTTSSSSTSAFTASSSLSTADLHVGNVSVHRVRYERDPKRTISIPAAQPEAGEARSDNAEQRRAALEQHDLADEQDTDDDEEDDDDTNGSSAEEATLVRALLGRTWLATASQLTGVIVAWEDHALAVQARPADQQLCSAARGGARATDKCVTNAKKDRGSNGRDVSYEVQMWVNGWGFDSVWHPANRRVVTRDPFVVLHDLPQEQEMQFRVRMKVKTMTGLLSGLFASEIDGPWSDTVTLSPSKEDAVEAIVSFLVANKAFGITLTVCIGLSIFVILRLVIGSGLDSLSQHHDRVKSAQALQRTASESAMSTDEEMDEQRYVRQRRRRRVRRAQASKADLEQEIEDLQQELADSEAEVRRLMMYRGYGIESLSADALDALETELRHALRVVQKQRRNSGFPVFESSEETDEEDGEPVVADPVAHSISPSTTTSLAQERDRVLETVFEDDEAHGIASDTKISQDQQPRKSSNGSEPPVSATRLQSIARTLHFW